MQTLMLQDWTTIRGATTTTTLIQGASQWLDMTRYQDVQFWIDVGQVSLGSWTALNITFETAPAKDEILFQPMIAAIAMSVVGTPAFAQALLSGVGGATLAPVAQWLRWRLTPTGGTPSLWDVTFRVIMSANAPGN